MARRKKQRLETKYIVRRMLLSLVLLAVIGLCVYLAATKILPGKKTEPPPPSQENMVDTEPQPDPEAPSEPSQESEPPPEPESSSEPGTSPVSQEIPSSAAWSLILANMQNPLPQGYAPPELAAVSGEYRVDSRIAEPLMRMLADAKADGINLLLCSAYRSEEYQQTLYSNKTQEFIDAGRDPEAAVAAAATIVAKPGTSEHQTGLALDIVCTEYTELNEGFAATPAAKWLVANAWEYGFILRYPKDKKDITQIIFEPWHYRFVGKEAAAAIQTQGLCLEEYLGQANRVAAPQDTDSEPESRPEESGSESSSN